MKEDEREVLARVVQNIDEQEIFLEFASKADTIREAWQIDKIFENRMQAFMKNIETYGVEINSKEEQLRGINAEIENANNLLREANDELSELYLKLEEMQSKAMFYRNKILRSESAFLLDDQPLDPSIGGSILDLDSLAVDFKPVGVVDVHVKNGGVARARVAQQVYPRELYVHYRKVISRLLKLKDRVLELELNNSKLEVELRDLSMEDSYKDNIISRLNKNPLSDRDIRIEEIDFTSRAEDVGVQRKIEEKKELIEGIFSQLNADTTGDKQEGLK